MAEISQLDQVRLDAQRITLKRIQEAEEQKAWQESQDGGVALGEAEEAVKAVEVEVPTAPEVKTVKAKKGQK